MPDKIPNMIAVPEKKKRGRPLVLGRGARPLVFNCPEQIRVALKRVRREDDVSESEAIRQLIRNGLAQRGVSVE